MNTLAIVVSAYLLVCFVSDYNRVALQVFPAFSHLTHVRLQPGKLVSPPHQSRHRGLPVFWILLLLCAGDIERNPGPVDALLVNFPFDCQIPLKEHVAVLHGGSNFYRATVNREHSGQYDVHFYGWKKNTDTSVERSQIFKLPNSMRDGKCSSAPICSVDELKSLVEDQGTSLSPGLSLSGSATDLPERPILAASCIAESLVLADPSIGDDASNSTGLTQQLGSLSLIDTTGDSASLPLLSTVQTSWIPTVRYVPIALRNEWSQILTTALENCVKYPFKVDHWTLLFMLPKCVLRAPSRGGTRHASANFNAIRDRIKRWKNGEVDVLWKEATATKIKSKRGSDDSNGSSLRRAKGLAQLGQYGRAAKALNSEGLAPSDKKTLGYLRELHPRSAAPQPFPPSDHSFLAYQFEESFVLKALKGFPSGTASGPSRTFPEHFLNAAECPTPVAAERALTAVTKLVNALAAGKIAPEVAPWLCSANLYALKKAKGGVRPIAVGEVLRRLTAKCLARAANSEAQAFLCPHQLGVATKGGVEAIVHSTKLIMEKCRREGLGILMVDFENAFNSLDRTHILTAIRDRLPGLVAFSDLSYSQHSNLIYESSIINSEHGVQQGDPLGPLLFAATLHSLVEKIAKDVPDLSLNAWYLDDGICAGKESSLLSALEIISCYGKELGLNIKLGKCELWSQRDFPHIPAVIPRSAADGFQLLGAPIGNSEFAITSLSKRIEKASICLEKLEELDDPQISLGIIKSCLGTPKLTYSLRTLAPRDDYNKTLSVFDEGLRDALSFIAGSPVTDNAWWQACLPIALGGLGIRRAADQHRPAYIGSVVATRHLVEQLTGFDASESEEFMAIYNSFAQNATGNPCEGAVDPSPQPCSQKWLQSHSDALSHKNLIQCTSNGREKVRLNSLTLPHAGAWLSAVPIKGLGLYLSASEFQAVLRYRLGLPVYSDERRCPYCAGILDILGDHSLNCGGHGDRIARHDRLRDAIHDKSASASLAPRKEQKDLIPGSRSKPGDIFIPSWKSGKPAAFDVTVTSSLQASVIVHAAETSGYALKQAEEKKFSKHNQGCEDQGITFIPLAVETLGGWSPLAVKTLRRIAILADARLGTRRDALAATPRLMQMLSICVMRGNANMLVTRAP